MDYDLTRLGTREFEHLTQALALRVLGAGVEVFGDGPDGGREAEFRGTVNYPVPSPEGPWVGYGVLQAKFRARSLGTEADTAWFLAESKHELRRWADPDSRRREIPKFLLLATNVVLSPVATAGGIDKVKRELDGLIKELRLPIKDWRVWHFDQLNTLLDNYPDVRQPYEALITSGDVLAHLRRVLDGSGAVEIAERATAYSVMQLKADRQVRLHQAGEGDNQRLNLADIGIDLKSTIQDSSGSAKTVKTISEILKRGDRILRPSHPGPKGPAHCVILGGPGQGKTTLSQLLCQAYRVAFLEESRALLSSEQSELLHNTQAHLRTIGVERPLQHRWPVRIDLAAYSDAIAGGENVSILKHLARQVNESAPEVNANHLRTWLGKWPWLLVLDGLDEVASNLSREAVISKLGDFYTEARQVDADLFVVATSRPQGYRQEFGEFDYTHLLLSPLETDEAVSYAEILTKVRFPGDSDTAKEVFSRLRVAASADLTARLMRTPLQVTIMSVLLERRERVPQQRYRLFDVYYETIYSREVGKPGPTGNLLDQHKTTIDRIHQQVGLRLHAMAEFKGDHDASISVSDLEQITLSTLKAAGYDDPQSTGTLVDRLVRAATTRLVLLAPRGDGFGFDVRSLQEFMAAQSIARDQAVDITERLRTIAWSAHWRNTWLLAAGNVFFHQGRQRHNLMNLLREIQLEDEVSLLVKPGSLLAVELLDDDVSAATPKFRRLLVQLALELLDAPPSYPGSSILARVLTDSMTADPGCRPFVFQALERAASSTGVSAVSTLEILRAMTPLATPDGARARQLLDDIRRSAGPAVLSVGEAGIGCWPHAKKEESVCSLYSLLDFPGDPRKAPDNLRWAAKLQVQREMTAHGIWVPTHITGRDVNPSVHAADPEVRRIMMASANERPTEDALIVTTLRNWLQGWGEARMCGPYLLDVMAHDEDTD